MAEENVQQGQVPVADEETKFKNWLKERYEIEDDPDTFKGKRQNWEKSAEEVPQYQATLTALIQHVRDQEAATSKRPVRVEDEGATEEERLRTIMKLDPYEGMSRMLKRFSETQEERFRALQQESVRAATGATARSEAARRAKEMVEAKWPEAMDPKSELHQTGKAIFQNEMSEQEKRHPQSFLIATERAAGRLGIAPKDRRTPARRASADASAQSVSRGAARRPADDNDDEPLSAEQRKIIAGMDIDPKVYKRAKQIRAEQAKRQRDED